MAQALFQNASQPKQPYLVSGADHNDIVEIVVRRTEQELALSRLFMLPSAHYKGVGVRIASFRSWIPTPPAAL